MCVIEEDGVEGEKTSCDRSTVLEVALKVQVFYYTRDLGM